MTGLRGAAAIVGIGELAPMRSTGSEIDVGLMARAGSLAMADAGVTPKNIDGLLVHPYAATPLFGPSTVAEYLGLRPRYAGTVDLGGATGAGMVWRAAAAIATGMCTTCLCVTASRARPIRPAQQAGPGSNTRPASSRDRSASAEFEGPYGAWTANVGYAQIAMRYQHEHKLTDEQRAQVAVAQRANARLHPDALFRDHELTIDEVLASELICDPLHLLEIVMPVGGAAAVIVTAADRADDHPQRSVYLLGAGEMLTHRSLPEAGDLTNTAIRPAADAAFAMAGVDRADIGLASLYDCYTITVLLTLEDAGFCAKGEAGGFVDDHDLRWCGDFPLNTHGGQLSFGQAGIAGGTSHITEAVTQLRRDAGDRQIHDLDLAFVNGNGGVMSEQVSLILGSTR